jgi:hypothetical protein
MGRYHDDDSDESPEYVRRKATAEGGPARDFGAQERSMRRHELMLMFQDMARFPDGCTIPLPDGRRITVVNVVKGPNITSQVVRYHSSAVLKRNGSMSMLRMPVPAFLRMVEGAQAERPST